MDFLQEQTSTLGKATQSGSRLVATLTSRKGQQLLFYAAFGLFVFAVLVRITLFGDVVGRSWLETAMKLVKVVAALLLLVKFAFQKPNVRRVVVTVVLLLVGFAAFVMTGGEDFLFFSFLFIGASEQVEIGALAKISLCVTGFVFAVTVVCSLAGVIPVFSTQSSVRYALGFEHPNTLGLVVAEMCISAAVLLWGKWPLFVSCAIVCIAVVASVFVYFTAYSRTSILVICFTTVLLIASILLRKKPKVLVVFSMVLLGIALVFTFGSMVLYDESNSVFAALNAALSHRLDYLHQYYEHGVLLFGSTWQSDLPLDMAFGRILLKYGAIAAIVFAAMIAAALVKAYREQCFNAVIFGLTIFIFYGLSEVVMMEFNFDYFLIALAPALYGGSLSVFGPSIDVIYGEVIAPLDDGMLEA